MGMADESKLTVQHAWARVMLKAPDGPGRSRHVSLDELQQFIDRAKAEARAISPTTEKYQQWLAGRNVALMDSQLYTYTPWGERQEGEKAPPAKPCKHPAVGELDSPCCTCVCPQCYSDRPGKHCICPQCRCNK